MRPHGPEYYHPGADGTIVFPINRQLGLDPDRCRCEMKKRGRVLRNFSRGQGLVMSEGEQLGFGPEAWQSSILPQPGQVVDMELDQRGQVQSIRVVEESQLSPQPVDRAGKIAREAGKAGVSRMVARVGVLNLCALGLLILGWFFLPAFSLETPLGTLSSTAWQLVGLLSSSDLFEALMRNDRGESVSVYGVLAVLAIPGPFLRFLWRRQGAILGGFLPLAYLILVASMACNDLGDRPRLRPPHFWRRDSIEQFSSPQEPVNTARLGAGAYLTMVSGLYFASAATRDWLRPKKHPTSGNKNAAWAA